MKKWFQFFTDIEGEDESVPVRVNPDDIKGYRRWTTHTTKVFTTIGEFIVVEEYEKFSSLNPLSQVKFKKAGIRKSL